MKKQRANRKPTAVLTAGIVASVTSVLKACGPEAVTLETHAQQPETVKLGSRLRYSGARI